MKRAAGFLVLVSVVLFSTRAWPLDRIPIAHSALTASQAILFVTRDAGIFRKHDLEPQIIYIVGGPTNTAALLAGSVDFAIFAGPASVAANLAGADTAILMSFVNTMEHFIFSQPGIKKPEELRGKKMGIARPGSSDEYGGRTAL
jgi:NitT/TauT family transport system substrate-binding protein